MCTLTNVKYSSSVKKSEISILGLTVLAYSLILKKIFSSVTEKVLAVWFF